MYKIRGDNTAQVKSAAVRVMSVDADWIAFDQLPPEWKDRVRDAPIRFSSEAILEAIRRGVPDRVILENFLYAMDVQLNAENATLLEPVQRVPLLHTLCTPIS